MKKLSQKTIAFLCALMLICACVPVQALATDATTNQVTGGSAPSASTDATSDGSVIDTDSTIAPDENTDSATSGTLVPSSTTSTTDSQQLTTLTDEPVVTVQAAEETTGLSASDEGSAYATGEVLVIFNDGTSQTAATETIKSADTVATDEITDATLVATTIDDGTLTADMGDEPIALVDVADDTTVVQAIAELQADPNVAYSQPNYLYYPLEEEPYANQADSTLDNGLTTQTTTIDDPYGSSASSTFRQWFLQSTDSFGLGCYEAWDYARCERSVGVAVIDTGCNVNHEDLDDNIAGAFNAYNHVQNRTEGVTEIADETDVTDSHGNGTHVCGIVAAETNNGVGISGVSYNATIVPIKASYPDNSFRSDTLYEAYAYLLGEAGSDIDGDGTRETVAQEYNVRVINMSLGGPIDTLGGLTPDKDIVLKQVDNAYDAGILTVCAAGNAASNATVPYYEYPGDYATCMSVINTKSNGEISSSSNYNTSDVDESSINGTKDISAPGSGIYSTVTSGGYDYKSGTSMASPVVAGIAALLFSADPTLTPDEVKTILYTTATDRGEFG